MSNIAAVVTCRNGKPKGWSVEKAAQISLLETLGEGWQGIHAENGLVLTLFSLICWDAVNAASAGCSAESR